MFTPRAIHIIEPDLVATGSHFYTQAVAIARASKARGIPVKIYCRKGSSLTLPDIEFAEVFHFSIWAEHTQPTTPEFFIFENYFLVNRAFFQDLCSIPCSNFSSDDLVYFPGLHQNQVEAIADWMGSMSQGKRPHIAITLRYLNSRMQYNEVRGYTAGIEFLYRQSLCRLVERHPPTHLFSDTEALSNIYRQMTGLPVSTLPIPQLDAIPACPSKIPTADRTLSILYIGTLSIIRGSGFLANLVKSALNSLPNVSFTIQINAELSSPDVVEIISALEQMAPRVKLLLGTLTPEEYVEAMQACDIFLLPYSPAFYAAGSSGVFTEAAALGKVLVVTAETTMATTALAHKLGAVISPQFTEESFLEALRTAVVNFNQLDELAKLSQPAFASENSPEGFLNKMFSLIG